MGEAGGVGDGIAGFYRALFAILPHYAFAVEDVVNLLDGFMNVGGGGVSGIDDSLGEGLAFDTAVRRSHNLADFAFILRDECRDVVAVNYFHDHLLEFDHIGHQIKWFAVLVGEIGYVFQFIGEG